MTAQTLFGQPASPATLIGDTTAYTLTMQFTLSQAAPLTGIWFYSAPGATVVPSACGIFAYTSPGNGTLVPGASNVTPSWSGAPGSGWVRCAFDGSVTLAAGTIYKVAVWEGFGSNWYAGTHFYWSASGLTSGIITAPDDASGDGGQDSYVATTSGLTYPSTSYLASNYWIDVEVTPGATLSGAAALASAAVLTAPAIRSAQASAGLSAAPALNASGTRALTGHASLLAAPALTAPGTRGVPGHVSLLAAPALTAPGIRGVPGQAHLLAAPGLAAPAVLSRLAQAALAALPGLTATGAREPAVSVSLSAQARVVAYATAGPDLQALWAAYQAAQLEAHSSWALCHEAREAGGSISSGLLFSAAYQTQNTADMAYAAWQAADRAAFPGSRG